jgi:hypothetical protein
MNVLDKNLGNITVGMFTVRTQGNLRLSQQRYVASSGKCIKASIFHLAEYTPLADSCLRNNAFSDT